MHHHLRALLRVETEGDFIEAGCDCDDAGLSLLPEEVVRARVECLDLPGHVLRLLDLPALPDPPADAVLGAQRLVHERLVVEGLGQLFFARLPLHLSLN